MPDAAPAPAATQTPTHTNGAAKAAPSQTSTAHSPRIVQTTPSKAISGESGKTSVTAAPEEGATESTWNDEADGKALAELLKRKSKADPKFRVRVRGEEKGIESTDDLLSIISDAQRGRGASKLVEETNAERKQIQSEKARIAALQDAFKGGDLGAIEDALAQLGGANAGQAVRALAQRQAEREKALSELTPTERQLLESNESMAAQLQQHQQQQKRALQQQQEAERTKAVDSMRKEAHERASGILEALKLPAEKLDVLGPHLVTAMREAAEAGLELGRDVPPEALMRYATERATEASVGFFTGLQPAQQAEALGMKSVEGIVRWYLQHRKLAGAQPTEQKPAPRRDDKPSPILGSPAYFSERNRR